MAQNIYDTPAFFSSYTQLPRSVNGLSGAPEWPTLRKLVGDIHNTRALDLGCGLGWFCRWAVKDAHARFVHGIDLSENMLSRAREMTSVENFGLDGITYQRANLEELVLDDGQVYDFAYSSLTLHYLPTEALRNLLGEVFKCLGPGGRFVFSVEHPVMTAREDAMWKADNEGNVYWPLNSYWDEGLRVTNWLVQGFRKYHRTVETYVSMVLEVGFVVTALKESWEGLELRPRLQEKADGHRPFFLIIAVQKPKVQSS
ncbi:uncharacterized protein Z518_01513 [Rhinocladiella mackenziei CBS 650.93]|uniref:Methyltransferase domain-containing protein n=1 Tax=Rhinocladiella mackenziei CBS 650.93 TaxID=1442369 RepID=A0A0D2J3Z2_9EURO|nr:uncharacterized protein Z518_01513 [Rhinocladiella mackenziei CBS 650.93]KIX10431.1 hypothetical protein Z518_01513 [Rhinocladiella mackenziei CBS 650.93]